MKRALPMSPFLGRTAIAFNGGLPKGPPLKDLGTVGDLPNGRVCNSLAAIALLQRTSVFLAGKRELSESRKDTKTTQEPSVSRAGESQPHIHSFEPLSP